MSLHASGGRIGFHWQSQWFAGTTLKWFAGTTLKWFAGTTLKVSKVCRHQTAIQEQGEPSHGNTDFEQAHH
jgi:hypothetical protein